MPEQETEQVAVVQKGAEHSSGHFDEVEYSLEHQADSEQIGSSIELVENQFGALAFMRARALDTAHQRLVVESDSELASSIDRFHADLQFYLLPKASRHSNTIKEPIIRAIYLDKEVDGNSLTPELIELIGSGLETAATQSVLKDAVELLHEKVKALESRLDPDVVQMEIDLLSAVGYRERAEEALADANETKRLDDIKLSDKDRIIAELAMRHASLANKLRENGIDFEQYTFEVRVEIIKVDTLPVKIFRVLQNALMISRTPSN